MFDHPESIKDQSARVIEKLNERRASDGGEGYDVIAEYLSLGFEVAEHADSTGESEVTYVRESRDGKRADDEGGPSGDSDRKRNPLAIIGELSGHSINTTVKTSQAVYDIADSSIKNILNMSFSQLRNRKEKSRKEIADEQTGVADAESMEKGDGNGDARDAAEESKFVFDPPASRFEWRRHPIPARFPGVVDHAAVSVFAYACLFCTLRPNSIFCTDTHYRNDSAPRRRPQDIPQPQYVRGSVHDVGRGARDEQVRDTAASPVQRVLRGLRELPDLRHAGGMRGADGVGARERPRAAKRGGEEEVHVGGGHGEAGGLVRRDGWPG